MRSHIYIYIYIVMVISPFLFSQELTTLNEWTEIDCEGIDGIEHIWGMEDNDDLSVKYILSPNSEFPQTNTMRYKFIVDQNGAKLDPYNEGNDYGYEFSFDNDHKPFCVSKYEYDLTMDAFWIAEKYYTYSSIERRRKNGARWDYIYDMDVSNGRCFLLEKNIYHFNYDNGKFYKLDLTNKTATEYTIQYAPQNGTSVVIVNNIVYYFSKDGFCAMEISGTSTTANIINEVTVQDATSLLVTDYENRIWIINATDGVIEYNIKDKKTQKIANPLASTRDTRIDPYKNVCFYIENFLYYITNQKVYKLDTSLPDDPDNPVNPKHVPDQSGHHCGCLGLEFIFALMGLFIFLHCRKN